MSHSKEKLEQIELTEVSEDLGPSVELPKFGDRYQMIELLGQGGMGSVYKVYDPKLDKQFAVKVLRKELAEDVQAVRRFEQEIQAASELNHANLVPVYEHGKTDAGLPYLLMDYVEGENLAQRLSREKQLPVDRGLNIFMQACEALAHAHEKGVVHRDLKPSNIMLTKGATGADIVRVVDFGIAKIMLSEGITDTNTNLTQTGAIFGSPLYMSPEQCENNPQDARSDIYALGCVMHEVFTGVQLFKAENSIRIILKHLSSDPPPMSSLPDAKAVPKDLETIVLKCLEKAPDDRYQNADALLQDLRLVAQGKPISTRHHHKKKPIATRTKIIIACCVAVVVGIVVAPKFYLLSNLVQNVANGNVTEVMDADEVEDRARMLLQGGDYAQVAEVMHDRLKNLREKAVEIETNERRRQTALFFKDTYKQENKPKDWDKSPDQRQVEFTLAEDLQLVGKCEFLLAESYERAKDPIAAQIAYGKALESYKESVGLWKKWGDLRPPLARSAVTEYAELLEKFGQTEELNKLKEFAATQVIRI